MRTQEYFDVGSSFKQMLNEFINRLNDYAMTADENELIGDICELIQENSGITIQFEIPF